MTFGWRTASSAIASFWKFSDQRPLEIGIRRSLQARIERLDYDLHPARLTITRDIDLSVTPMAETFRDLVAVVDQAVFQLQLTHK
jgi:hypothetical protein